jgi:Uma2 family endonuclease
MHPQPKLIEPPSFQMVQLPRHFLEERVMRLSVVGDSTEVFDELCRLNPDFKIEQTSTGELIVMPPTGGETGFHNALLTHFLIRWMLENGGRVFDSSTLFALPNGARRSPDAAWVSAERIAAIPAADRRKPLPLCPDFVIELSSPTDDVDELKEKMTEFIENGAQLGWLIVPEPRRAFIYRAGCEVEELSEPRVLSGEAVLPGFELDLDAVFTPL